MAYEDFVRDPETELGRVVDFAGVEVEADSRQAAVAGVRADSVGKGRAKLDQEAVHRLERLVGDTLGRFGYG